MAVKFAIVPYFWEDPADELDVLARLTAEKIRGDQIEAERQHIASMIRRAFPGGWWHGHKAFIGSFDSDDLYDDEIDEYKPGRLVIPCRGCRRPLSPLCAESRVIAESGWRWVGISHQQPETDYFFACGWCGTPMLFTVVTPQ